MNSKKRKFNILNNLRLISFTILIIISTYEISHQNYKESFYKEIVSENTTDVSDDIKKSVDNWVEFVKSVGMWNETYQQRLDNIEWYTVSHPFMTYRGNDENPLGITYFEYQDDGTILPTTILLSDRISFDMYGTEYVVFHELGHAILLLDDIRPEDLEHNYQLMWYQGLSTYEKFSNTEFMRRKVLEQVLSPNKEELYKIKSHKYCSRFNNK